jgi:hypothetical protein
MTRPFGKNSPGRVSGRISNRVGWFCAWRGPRYANKGARYGAHADLQLEWLLYRWTRRLRLEKHER